MTWLKDIRKEKQMTQAKVAEEAHISQGSYSNIERGNKKPCVETAQAIAKVLGFDWTEFYRVSKDRLKHEDEIWA